MLQPAFSPHTRPPPQQPIGRFGEIGLGLFGLPWTACSLLFVILPLGMFIRDWNEYVLLRDTGVTAEAVVVSRRIDADSEGDSYYLTYQYAARRPNGDSQRFTAEKSVSRSTYTALPPESRVTILYAAPEPAVSALKDSFGPPGFILLFACMGSLFTLVGLGLLYSSAKSIRRAGLLASRGQVVSGTIIDRWTVTDSEGDRTYVIAYRFTVPLPDGDSRPFTRAEYNKAAYDSYLPGNGVRVRYLPENPTLCRLERN